MTKNSRENNSMGKSVPKTPEEMNEFMIENKPLILTLLRSYRGMSDFEDLIQEASIGFFKGITTYDSSKGVQLTTYAYKCALNEVKMYLRQVNSKGRGSGTKPDSLETGDGSESYGQDRQLGRILMDTDSLDIEDKIYSASVFKAAIRFINSELDPDSRIVIYRFMEGSPQSETGKEIGVSQSKVSKMQKQVIDKIREELSQQGII